MPQLSYSSTLSTRRHAPALNYLMFFPTEFELRSHSSVIMFGSMLIHIRLALMAMFIDGVLHCVLRGTYAG